ncbi:MAG TPA: TetR/AcrR family transcriptional regulator [Solirubrobacterales bacterium]|nr:TetR/AcrR family transcriptional regulator [Solirubrobacterales bacterium]
MAAPAQRRRRLSAEERREHILRAGMEVFAERGYQEASMAEIARAAGITPAVIYDHFASKAELQITLLEGQTEELLTFVGTAVAGDFDDMATRFRIGVDAFFTFVEEHPYAWRMLFRDPPTDPAILSTYRRIHQQATAGIALFLRASAPPELLESPGADRDLEMFAEMLKMAQNGLAVWWYEHREVPRRELVDRVLEFAWVGFERIAAGERISP